MSGKKTTKKQGIGDFILFRLSMLSSLWLTAKKEMF